MKKHLLVFAVVFLAVAIAAPAFAAVEFKYGGQFRARVLSSNNVLDGTENAGAYYNGTYNADDNRNFIDQRLRLYFTFEASKNLKLVTKWEVGDQVWGFSGSGSGNVGAGRGGNVGADGVAVEVKNIYVEFNIPNTPTTAIVGIQGIVLMDSWIIDDDFSAAVFKTKLAPFTVTLGYVAGQSGWEQNTLGNSTFSNDMPFTNPQYNIDSVFATLDYAEGPFKGSLVFYFQDGHSTDVSVNPASLSTAARSSVGVWQNQGFFVDQLMTDGTVRDISARNNYLFDLGVNLTYKVDWLLAYFNFVKNFGSVDLRQAGIGTTSSVPGSPLSPATYSSVDYTGFMFDAGVTWFCGPYTLNIGGFYTTGPDIDSRTGYTPAGNWAGVTDNYRVFNGISSTDVNWFTYPLATSKYFSEIIGGGILGDDLYANRGFGSDRGAGRIGGNNLDTVYWRGYGFPTNLWTITFGGSWQVLESTKISGSYWYFGTSNDVPVAYATRTVGGVILPDYSTYQMSSSIGHELNFYVDHKIVDGLTLTLVGAYLIADDAFAPLPLDRGAVTTSPIVAPTASDAYELGARLQWNF